MDESSVMVKVEIIEANYRSWSWCLWCLDSVVVVLRQLEMILVIHAGSLGNMRARCWVCFSSFAWLVRSLEMYDDLANPPSRSQKSLLFSMNQWNSLQISEYTLGTNYKYTPDWISHIYKDEEIVIIHWLASNFTN